jgi:L-rhamnose mutarotase
MPTFLLISRHAPESCWMFNEKTRQIHVNLLNKLESLLKKYNIKLLGAWFVLPEHTLYEVFDAPSLDVFQKMSMEPEIVQWSAFNTMEIKMVATVNDVMGLLKQPVQQM